MADNVTELHAGGEQKLPSKKALQELKAKYVASKADMDEARGEIGSAIKNAENDIGVNRKAFKLAMQCENMNPAKLTDFLASFDHYRTVFELDNQQTLDLAAAE